PPDTSQSAVQKPCCPWVVERTSNTRAVSASTSVARMMARSMGPPVAQAHPARYFSPILNNNRASSRSLTRWPSLAWRDGSEAAMAPLQVIAAPRRLRTLELVWDQELSAGQIATHFEVSWPAVSQHLRVLKEAGFLVERRQGTSRIYRTDQAAL